MDGENVIGYIDSLTSFGIITPQKRSLIVTNKRLLILDTKSVSATAASAGFAYVFGAFGRGMANRVNKEELVKAAQQLANQDLDQLLQADSGNVGLDIQSIRKVEIDRKRITIFTDSKKYAYGLANPDAKNKKADVYEAYVNTLKQVLGGEKVSAK